MATAIKAIVRMRFCRRRVSAAAVRPLERASRRSESGSSFGPDALDGVACGVLEAAFLAARFWDCDFFAT
jgi:hypothetical protein